MLIAAHVFEVLLLGLLPWLVARVFARRWGRPLAIFGAGLLCFVFAEVARIGLARGLGALWASGAIPLPEGEDALLWTDASIAGVIAALTDQALLVFALRRWVEPVDTRTGLLLGLGRGGAEAMLSAVLVVGMAAIAIVGEGSTFEDLEAMGFEGRAAVRVGMKVLAWWEASPADALVSALESLLLVAMHAGLAMAVARAIATRRRRWLAGTLVAQALAATSLAWAAAKTPGMGIEIGVHLAAATIGLALGLAAARGSRNESETA